MTTKYAVKRCHTFGFAQTLKDAFSLFPKLEGKNFIFLHDGHHAQDGRLISRIKRKCATFVEYKKIEDINASFINKKSLASNRDEQAASTTVKSAIVFVELGYDKRKIIKVPLEHDDMSIIQEFDKDDKQYCPEFKKALIDSLNHEDILIEKKLSNEFITFLIDIYPQLHDHHAKHLILRVLDFNGYNTINLERDYPLEYEEKMMNVVVSSDIFSDIEISVDAEDSNISTTLYKPDKDALKKAALGKATQLDAFSENKFAIIHTKKRAGIDNKTRNQNHDILDTLAVNGVMKSPDTTKPLSMYKLMKELELFDEFDIVFIHPSYEIKCMNAEYPCEQIIPAYKINEGEILAVAYRYLVTYFFGYCSIVTDSMLEWRYYI